MMTASPDDVNTLLIARESITDATVLLSFLFSLGGGNGKATVGRHNFGGGNGKAPLVVTISAVETAKPPLVVTISAVGTAKYLWQSHMFKVYTKDFLILFYVLVIFHKNY